MNPMHDAKDTRDAITKGMQMTLLAGFLGWMMDGYEQALFPTLAGPALKSMVPADVATLGVKAIKTIADGGAAPTNTSANGQFFDTGVTLCTDDPQTTVTAAPQKDAQYCIENAWG